MSDERLIESCKSALGTEYGEVGEYCLIYDYEWSVLLSIIRKHDKAKSNDAESINEEI